MDIGNGKGPSLSQLSTMALHSFVIDDVKCSSIESVIQAMKFEKPGQSASVCADKPKVAKERGKKNFNWARGGNTYWKGQAMARDSSAHADFIDHVVKEVARQCPAFSKALIDSANVAYTAAGKTKESESPVTEAEYCRALTSARKFALTRVASLSAMAVIEQASHQPLPKPALG